VGLCTLAEAKLQLGKTTAADDTELQSYIDALTGPVERYCGVLVSRVVSNEPHYRVCGPDLGLLQARVVSMTSVTEYLGTVARTYTEIASPNLAGTYTYMRDGALLTRIGPGGYPLTWEGQLVLVSYTAGFSSVPTEANLAARMIVQHLWRTQNGGAGLPSLSDEDVVTMPEFGYAIPRKAKELLDGLIQPGGFA